MDVPQEQKLEAPLIKVEVLEIEEPGIKKEDQFEVYKYEDIKKEEPDSEPKTPKYEIDTFEEIRTDELILKNDIDEHHQNNREEHPPTPSETQQQNEAETSKTKPFKCTYQECYKSFTFKKGLARHIKSFHCEINKGRLLKCQYRDCGQSYKNINLLRSHLREHTGDRPFACDYPKCKKTFKAKTTLKSHQLVHSDLKAFKCSVEGCKKAYKSKRDLTTHLRVHPNPRPFTCTQEHCQNSFKSKNSLENHKKFNCVEDSVCQIHMRAPETVKPFRCPVDQCDAGFRDNYHLKVHMRTHSEDKILHCDFEGCGLKFWKRVELYDQETHFSKMSLCPHEDCSESFENHELLRVHLRNHLRKSGTADGSSKEDFGVAREVKTYARKQYVRKMKASDKSSSADDVSLTQL